MDGKPNREKAKEATRTRVDLGASPGGKDGGFFVSRQRKGTLRRVCLSADLFSARKSIEVAIVRMATTNMTPEALAGLEAYIEVERNARESGDTDATILLSGEFHMLLADIAGNSTLKRYLEDIVFREFLIIQLYEKRNHDTCPADEHRLIVEALKAADPDLVAKRIKAHIDSIAGGLDPSPRPTEFAA